MSHNFNPVLDNSFCRYDKVENLQQDLLDYWDDSLALSRTGILFIPERKASSFGKQ